MFTIGADPEVFVGVNNRFVSAHNLVPGTKVEPFRLVEGAVQVDGMALEYNVDPCTERQEFVTRMKFVRNQMEDMVKGYEILPTCCVKFSEDDVKDVPALNFNLGCSVDFNAYTEKPNVSPDSKKMMRTAGGHVHIGGFFTKKKFLPDHYSKCIRLSKLMDRELGVYSLLWDTDVERRSMYGKAGCFRPALYGMEYRSLSNVWIFNDELVSFVYDATRRAYEMMLAGEDVKTTVYEDIINNSCIDLVPEDEHSSRIKEILNV